MSKTPRQRVHESLKRYRKEVVALQSKRMRERDRFDDVEELTSRHERELAGIDRLIGSYSDG